MNIWSNSKKKCLVVDVASQVGKTFAIQQFGEIIEITLKNGGVRSASIDTFYI